MSRRGAPLLLDDIWEAIEKIDRYVAGLDHDTFIKDDKPLTPLSEIWKLSVKPLTAYYRRISKPSMPRLNGAKSSA
jgi:hypothetical protein